VQVRLFRPFVERVVRARTAEERAHRSRARPHQGAGRPGEPLCLDVMAALRCSEQGAGLGSVSPRRSRRALRALGKEFTPAMVLGGVRELAAKPNRQAAVHGRHPGRRDAPVACRGTHVRAAAGRSHRGGVLRARRRRHGGRQQELDQDPRRSVVDARAGLLRLRQQEVRRDHDLAPALRPGTVRSALPDPARRLRGVPPIRFPRPLRRARLAGPGATLLLNAPFRPERVGRAAASRCRSRSSSCGNCACTIDADAVAREAGVGGRINTIMQVCFFALCRRAAARRSDRAHQGCDPEELRQEGRRDRAAQLRRRRCGAAAPARGARPAARPRHGGAPQRCRSRRRTSCSASRA
jgi:pyruvate-ferredoxin/flavodoxin oxidoreductase